MSPLQFSLEVGKPLKLLSLDEIKSIAAQHGVDQGEVSRAWWEDNAKRITELLSEHMPAIVVQAVSANSGELHVGGHMFDEMSDGSSGYDR